MGQIHSTSIERLNKAVHAAGFAMAPAEDEPLDEIGADWQPDFAPRSNLPAVVGQAGMPRDFFASMTAAANRLRARWPLLSWRAPA